MITLGKITNSSIKYQCRKSCTLVSSSIRKSTPTGKIQIQKRFSVVSHGTTGSSLSSIPRPTNAQLKILFMSSAIPMIGFGFMDNFIMIQAGSYIDSTFGVTLGMTTLTAAACGQVVSDVSGVVFGGALERFLSRHGFIKPSKLSSAQVKLPISRNITMLGSVLGVILGCTLGAFTLLFHNNEDVEQEKFEKLVNKKDDATQLLQSVLTEFGKEMNIDKYVVHMVSNHASLLIAKDSTYEASDISIISSKENANPMVEKTQDLGKILADFNTGAAESSVYVPVLSKDGGTLAVIQLIRNENNVDAVDILQEERLMKLFSKQVGAIMDHYIR